MLSKRLEETMVVIDALRVILCLGMVAYGVMMLYGLMVFRGYPNMYDYAEAKATGKVIKPMRRVPLTIIGAGLVGLGVWGLTW